jgi:hypothetical protein
MSNFWKHDWEERQDNVCRWWRREGAAICIFAPADKPWLDVPEPTPPADLRQRWCDPEYRALRTEYRLAREWHGGEAVPIADTNIGPGSLGTFLGSQPGFSESTVWYHPCITDPESHPELRFDPADEWFQVHLRVMEACKRRAQGHYLVGLPDLIENIDTLSQMRDPQTLMIDLIERPRWVRQRVTQINRAFFDSFDALCDVVRGEDGSNAFWAFNIWGPGRTAKVQCDASAMFSTEMFDDFVIPALTEQCRWLDYSLYHLDGTNATHHLDSLLKIDALDAIEWTPQAGIEGGGHPRWYPLYRKILEAGKGVQAIGVRANELIPLLDACGSKGMCAFVGVKSQAEGEELLKAADRYR